MTLDSIWYLFIYFLFLLSCRKKLSNQEDYGIRNNGSEKHYHLESETDFPALSSTKNTMVNLVRCVKKTEWFGKS